MGSGLRLGRKQQEEKRQGVRNSVQRGSQFPAPGLGSCWRRKSEMNPHLPSQLPLSPAHSAWLQAICAPSCVGRTDSALSWVPGEWPWWAGEMVLSPPSPSPGSPLRLPLLGQPLLPAPGGPSWLTHALLGFSGQKFHSLLSLVLEMETLLHGAGVGSQLRRAGESNWTT